MKMMFVVTVLLPMLVLLCVMVMRQAKFLTMLMLTNMQISAGTAGKHQTEH